MTFHAAYEPSARSGRIAGSTSTASTTTAPRALELRRQRHEDLFIEAGWASRSSPGSSSSTSYSTRVRATTSAPTALTRKTLATLRPVEAWMRETADPLLAGPIEPPAGAIVNRQDARSPAEHPRGIDRSRRPGVPVVREADALLPRLRDAALGKHARLQGTTRQRRSPPPQSTSRRCARPVARAGRRSTSTASTTGRSATARPPSDESPRHHRPGAGPPTTATSSGRWSKARPTTASSPRS